MGRSPGDRRSQVRMGRRPAGGNRSLIAFSVTHSPRRDGICRCDICYASAAGEIAMATHTTESRSAAIRARLNHPIIDSDGHTAEFEPALFDYLRNVAGARVVDRLKSLSNSPMSFQWYRLTPAERRDRRLARPLWAAHPTRNTLDRATSSLP